MSGRTLAAVFTIILGTGLIFGAEGHAQDARRFALVMDASNSMWGQVDDRAKIDIARDVVARLLRDWPEKQPLGLVAYGHRKKQDCSDIEVLLPVGPLDREKMTESIAGLTPRGRTPLTDAVRQAATALDFETGASTVILLSDGIESCEADPCAMAEELAGKNGDFRIHVIGFDVEAVEDKSQLQCLAEKTGGLFVAAKSADELDDALRKLTGTATAQAVQLSAAPRAPVDNWILVWWKGQTGPEDRITLVPRDAPDDETGDTIDATKRAPGKMPTPKTAGDYELRYLSGTDGAVLAREPVTLVESEASLDGDARVPAGGTVIVNWAGPGLYKDRIALVEKGAPPDARGRRVYTRIANPAKLLAPDTPGEFELRYIGREGSILAVMDLTVMPVDADLDAPESVNTGAAAVVHWSGPGTRGDFLTMVTKDAKDDVFGPKVGTRRGNPAKVPAPDEAGEYEIRYITGQNNLVLTRAPITVVAVPASLEVVGALIAGGDATVAWKGPNGIGDRIVVVEAGEPDDTKGRAVYTKKGNPITMRAPGEAGEYEFRYVTGRSKTVLARLAATVSEPKGSLNAPDQAAAGGRVLVDWTGPNFLRDAIEVMEAGRTAGKPLFKVLTRNGNPASVTVPDKPGAYELHYRAGGKDILASRALTVVADRATLQAAEAADTGTEIAVTWTGPADDKDLIVLVKAAAPDDMQDGGVAPTPGLTIKAPNKEGQYELRYVSGADGTILARRTIIIR